MRMRPASVYGILNLFTKRSLRLLLNPPRQAYVKKDEAISIQKVNEKDFNYRNENIYYSCSYSCSFTCLDDLKLLFASVMFYRSKL